MIFKNLRTLIVLTVLGTQLPAAILVNQSGYNSSESKRFTAPLAADGSPFSVVTQIGEVAVFEGEIVGGIGDFSQFIPIQSSTYRIRLGNSPDFQYSYPFGIGPFWMERVSYHKMIQFMIDSRSGYGDATTWDVENAPFVTGIAWRDSHQFSFELRTLLQWYAANPDAFGIDRMPIEGSYPGLRDSLPEQTPEIVRLIHWAVDIYLRGQVNHTLIKEDLAYFVYYYPMLSEWIPQSLYHEAADYLYANWGNPARNRWNWHDISHTADLFQTYTVVGGTKGPFPPGHSIIPNMLMYEVALHDNRPDAEAYRTAARNQVQWIVDNLDPADPMITKGQRMSEHILVPALVEFCQRDSDGPVTGIKDWIQEWAEVVESRSGNFWDFRMYSEAEWTPEGWSQGYWNEPGNVAGFPASIYAATRMLEDPELIHRLEEIAVSHLDHVFGRNPYNRHFSFRAAQEEYGFEGVEMGWFNQYSGGYGDLGSVRGVLDGSPKHPAYPFNPAASYGYTEGWVAFNTAWNATMTWMATARTHITFETFPTTTENLPAVGESGLIRLRMRAPLNFSTFLAESVYITVTTESGDTEMLQLLETGPNTGEFVGTVAFANHASKTPHNGILEATAGHGITAFYGYDYFATTAHATAQSTVSVPPTSAPIITTPVVSALYTGLATSQRFSARGGNQPLTWSVSAETELPAGMNFDHRGILQGTPTFAGSFPILVSVSDASGLTTTKAFQIEVKELPPMILDAGQPGTKLTGTWTASTFHPDYFGDNYLNDGNSGKGSKSVEYLFQGLPQGIYQLSASWIPAGNRAANVPITAVTGVGTSQFTVNQKVSSGFWNTLGEVSVSTDGMLKVTISNTGTTGFVMADAIRATLLSASSRTRFNHWAESLDIPVDQQNVENDYSGNGIPNLLEFYSGGTLATARLPLLTIQQGSLKPYAQLFLNEALPEVHLAVEISTDLISWTVWLNHSEILQLPTDKAGFRAAHLPLDDSAVYRVRLTLP